MSKRTVKLTSISRLRSTELFVSPSKQSLVHKSRCSSTFQAPIPPTSKGQPVYTDIDTSIKREDGGFRNKDPDAVFVVSGASRGIGLQFVKSLLQRTQGTVVAMCRSPENAEKLKLAISSMSLNEKNRVKMCRLDLENQNSIDAACSYIKNNFGRVDLLLNVAGILGDGQTTPGPERMLSKVDRYWMTKTFDVNVIGPVMLTQGLTPMMEQRRVKKSAQRDDKNRPKSVVVNLSARVGSVSDNELGGWYSYRMSKAALNQATRTISHELKRKSIWTIALHPGTTDTDLSKPFQRNVQKERLFPVDFTVESLLGVIESMQEANSGGLYDWAGKAIPF